MAAGSIKIAVTFSQVNDMHLWHWVERTRSILVNPGLRSQSLTVGDSIQGTPCRNSRDKSPVEILGQAPSFPGLFCY